MDRFLYKPIRTENYYNDRNTITILYDNCIRATNNTILTTQSRLNSWIHVVGNVDHRDIIFLSKNIISSTNPSFVQKASLEINGNRHRIFVHPDCQDNIVYFFDSDGADGFKVYVNDN